MFTDHHLPYAKLELSLRTDRRPLTRASEIRLRVKRAVNRGEV